MSNANEAAVETNDTTGTLGGRIVKAARLAVAVHLFESLAAKNTIIGRDVSIGGAGPVAPPTADRVHARRPFRIPSGVVVADGAD